MPHRLILLHPLAPAKPAVGRPCNGCGVCCAAEPCPLGMLVSRRWRGACTALRWEGDRYRCSLLVDRAVTPVARLRNRMLRRWIGAGAGCDASLAVSRAGPTSG